MRPPSLRHDHQDVRLRQVGVEHRLIGENELSATGAATRLRTKVLGHGGMVAIDDRCGLADYDCRKNDALSAEAGDTDFG
jgi:hypothetical protein